MLWRTKADQSPAVLAQAKARKVAADEAERARLLYVAMTRAETWLIVCGAGAIVTPSWYGAIQDGLATIECSTLACPTGAGLRHSRGDWHAGTLQTPTQDDAPTNQPPDWITQAAPTPTEAKPLNPSDLGGAKALAGETDDLTQDAAMARGTDIHLLLEHLPALPADQWDQAAISLLSPERSAPILDDVRAILTAPHLRDMFAPGTLAEVSICAQLNGQPMMGTIDRLIIGPDWVMAVDYKSNTVVPERSDQVPDGLLRQMGAYAAALGQIYPNHRIETAILWTNTATLMPLANDIVMAALDTVTTP